MAFEELVAANRGMTFSYVELAPISWCRPAHACRHPGELWHDRFV